MNSNSKELKLIKFLQIEKNFNDDKNQKTPAEATRSKQVVQGKKWATTFLPLSLILKGTY